MRTAPIRRALLIILVLSLTLQWLRADSLDLELRLEQRGRAPLPYQGVRLEVILRNPGMNAVEPVALLESSFTLLASDGPRTLQDGVSGARLTPSDRSAFTKKSQTALGRLSIFQKLVLKSGQREAVSFPVSHTPYGREVLIFREPGTYRLSVRYLARSQKPTIELTTEAVSIAVGKPEGVDAIVHQMLVNDASLAHLMNPFSFRFEPLDADHAAAVTSLERIILRYPKSSYADYARFALAKAYLQGPHGKGPMAPADAKVAATALLESINVKEWAYGPAALILLKSITTDRKKADKIKEMLDRDFPDSIEWLAEQAEMMELREDQTYPPRGPRRAKP